MRHESLACPGWGLWRAVLVIALVTGLIVLGGCGGSSDSWRENGAGTASLCSVSSLLGDLDGDGNPGVSDAIAILRIVVGFDVTTPLADCDGDGTVGVSDAILVLRCVVGFSTWPIGVHYPTPDRQISGVVVEAEFVVADGEVVEAVGDTVIQCNSASISGSLFSRPSGPGGANGAHITIEATGDVSMSGTIETAPGQPGDSATQTGGDGGDLTVSSSGGSITIGAPQGSAGSAQAGGPSFRTGDGADGTDEGAGGNGGSIRLAAPNGTLSVEQAAELFVIGRGGDGGRLFVGGADLPGYAPPPQLPNGGGDGGAVELDAQHTEGVELLARGQLPDGTPAYEATFDDGVVVGGAGGDAGGFYYGVDPQTGSSTWPTSVGARQVRPAQAMLIAGAAGGDGIRRAGHGQSISIIDGNTGQAGGDGRDVEVRGGDGGHCGGWTTGGEFVYIRGSGSYVAGNGGDVHLRAAAGKAGASNGNGGAGGGAVASGGTGGNTCLIALDGAAACPGRGGNAEAIGGAGGNGGSTCSPPGPGGGGGRGGDARATGGDGGLAVGGGGSRGGGGGAEATGGDGGNGGDGAPAGGGGQAGTATTTAGAGSPNGSESRQNGTPGSPGSICGNISQKLYSTITYSILNQRRVTIRPSALEVAVIPSQAEAVELGGDENPFRVTGTQSLVATADFGVLWGIHDYDKVYMYRTPSAGGDRPPDVILTTTGTQPGDWMTSLWYDQSNDRLYCTHGTSISVWHNASQAQANRAADRTIAVTGTATLTNISGDAERDVLFAITDDNGVNYRLICIDGIGTAQGTIAPSRQIDANNFGVGLAYSGASDRLYVGKHEPANPAGTARVLVISNASAASGVVTPDVLRGPLSGIDNYIVGLQVIAADDALFVGCANASLLAFPFASTIAGDTQPQSTGQMAGNCFLVVPAG